MYLCPCPVHGVFMRLSRGSAEGSQPVGGRDGSGAPFSTTNHAATAGERVTNRRTVSHLSRRLTRFDRLRLDSRVSLARDKALLLTGTMAACPDCVRGGKLVGEPRGHVETLTGAETYIVQPKDGKAPSKAIILCARAAQGFELRTTARRTSSGCPPTPSSSPTRFATRRAWPSTCPTSSRASPSAGTSSA